MNTFLGADLWQKQIEIAESVRDHRRTAVKSCHGSGKSYLAARIVIWFLHAFANSIVLTTAPTQNQVKNILWRNVNAAFQEKKRPLLGRCLQTQYDIDPSWYALGFKSEDTAADRFQGFHAENALVVIDEAAGVDDRVYEALDAVMTSEAARMLLIGNPTNPTGEFNAAFGSNRSLYNTITIKASDTPNIQAGKTIRPYLITQQWIDDAVEKHGADSPYVKARVDAEFPTISENNLIPLAWVERANARKIDDHSGVMEAGLDPARMGTDQTGFCIRHGMTPLLETAWSGLDTMETVGKVRTILSEYPGVSAIKIDVIGIGAGVYDRLHEEGYPVVPVNVSGKSSDPERWPNLRHELWWEFRELFRTDQISGPIDDMTIGQITAPRYSYNSRHSGAIIESKDDTKKRLGRSPDRAEAMMLAFLTPHSSRGEFEETPAELAEVFASMGIG